MSETDTDHRDLLAHTAEIVAAHVSNNALPGGDLPALIERVFASLSDLGAPRPEPVVELKPAVPIRKSVAGDHLVCLDCGRKLKMLKRHLASDHGMTPEEYRARWGLPADYPAVAPDYSAKRQALAREIGLGRKPEPKPEPKPAPKRRRKAAG